MLNKLLMILIALTLSGCVSFPAEVVSQYVGSCLKLKNRVFLLETRKDLYKSNRLISMYQSYGKYSTNLGAIEEDSKVYIKKLLQASDGSWGDFLRIQVEIVDGRFSGVIADVPVHAPYHPSPKWTKSFTLDPNALEFNEEIVEPCDT